MKSKQPLNTLCAYSICLFVIAASLAALPCTGQDQEPAPNCQVYIASVPEEAVVRIDDVNCGITPLTLTDVAPGQHLVSIEKQGYVTEHQSILLRAGQRSALDVSLMPKLGLALIHTQPPEANIRIGETDRGTSPLLLTDLPLGRHQVTVSAAGFLPRTVELILDDRVPQRLDIELVSNTATLEVDTTPTGAEVTINGISRGKTPQTIDGIPGGASTLDLALPGYEPVNRSLRLEAGQHEALTVALTPIPATLRVITMPPKARVYLDNEFRGLSPIRFDDLTPAAYRVRVEMQGYDPDARTITLARAADKVEEFRLQSNAGVLEIVTEPAGIVVFVDGKEVGTTSADADATDRVSNALILSVEANKSHTVELSREGYFSRTLPVMLKRNEKLSLHEKLKKRFIPDYEVVTDSGTERGVLIEVDGNRDIRLEVRPGIMRTISAKDVISARPIRRSAPAP